MTINDKIWQIKYNDSIDQNVFGLTNYESLTIYIKPGLCPQAIETTLIHEIVHAYLYSYGFCYKNEFTAEEVCEFVSFNIDKIKELYKIAKGELIKYGK